MTGRFWRNSSAFPSISSPISPTPISEHQLSYITHSNSGEGLLFYGDVTIPFVDRFPKGEIYNLLTTRPEDLKNEAKTE